jgi:hypothetical protein
MSKNRIIYVIPKRDNVTPEQLIGQYTAESKQYYHNNTTNLLVKVCQRNEPTRFKPKLYLVSRTTDNKYVFISSLYPQDNGQYIAEVDKVYMDVCLTDKTLTIIKKQNPYV